MSDNKQQKKNTGATTLQGLEQCLQQNHIPERFCEEVARMFSGATVTQSSLKHAEQMLKTNS